MIWQFFLGTFFALASISLGLVVIMSGVVAVALTLCLGALLGITRQSQSRKIIPMQIEVVMSHLGTPSFKWRQLAQSDHFLEKKYSLDQGIGQDTAPWDLTFFCKLRLPTLIDFRFRFSRIRWLCLWSTRRFHKIFRKKSWNRLVLHKRKQCILLNRKRKSRNAELQVKTVCLVWPFPRD